MYACTHETGHGFFEGFAERGISHSLFATDPHLAIRELTLRMDTTPALPSPQFAEPFSGVFYSSVLTVYVGWLHCLPYHLYQVVAQRLQVGFLAPLGRESFEGLSGIFDPFTTERLYFYVYVRYESRLNQCPYPPFPFPPITPIRALALAICTVLL
jgi:hypothetical protein